jgi:hypothetical protein
MRDTTTKNIVSTQLCVPDWPFYNRNPIKWLDSVPDRRGDNATSDGGGAKKS